MSASTLTFSFPTKEIQATALGLIDFLVPSLFQGVNENGVYPLHHSFSNELYAQVAMLMKYVVGDGSVTVNKIAYAIMGYSFKVA